MRWRRRWSFKVRCHMCGIRCKHGASDMQREELKISGYFFDGSARVEPRYFACCCTRGCRALHVLPDSKVPQWVRTLVAVSGKERLRRGVW